MQVESILPIAFSETTIQNVLTRTTGYLRTVTSHSLQPYRGCTYGSSLCGVACYVQHNRHLLQGRRWGEFLEARTNAAESYLANYDAERRWARKHGCAFGPRYSNNAGHSHTPAPKFSIFCSSATDPFVPQERRLGVTRSVLEAMCERPPDELVLQTHSHLVAMYSDLYKVLASQCSLRIHVSIETDMESLPDLAPHASSIERRFDACAELKAAGFNVVVTVSPLLPIREPINFFKRIDECANAVVLDHFIEGDGSADGSRTRRTKLPQILERIAPESVSLAYRDQMAAIAREIMPERVGISIEGFAGRYT